MFPVATGEPLVGTISMSFDMGIRLNGGPEKGLYGGSKKSRFELDEQIFGRFAVDGERNVDWQGQSSEEVFLVS